MTIAIRNATEQKEIKFYWVVYASDNEIIISLIG